MKLPTFRWLAPRRTAALVSALLPCFPSAAQNAAPRGNPDQVLREYRNFALSQDGDAARGQELFLHDERTRCIQCHSVDGSSSKAAPDLQSVGDKFPRRELIRAVLEPSAEIAVGFGTTIVTTRDGEELQGVIKQADADGIQIMGADGRLTRLSQDRIREQRGSNLSLMPEGLHAGLTREEFADLVGYLTTLRQPENLLTSNRGMPDSIPELARPVDLRPFLDEAMRFPHAFVQ